MPLLEHTESNNWLHSPQLTQINKTMTKSGKQTTHPWPQALDSQGKHNFYQASGRVYTSGWPQSNCNIAMLNIALYLLRPCANTELVCLCIHWMFEARASVIWLCGSQLRIVAQGCQTLSGQHQESKLHWHPIFILCVLILKANVW